MRAIQSIFVLLDSGAPKFLNLFLSILRAYIIHKFRCSGANLIPCEAGSYNFIAGSNLCNSCPEGWYCPGTGTNYVEDSKFLQGKWLRPCYSSSKYYCPAGSSRPMPVAEGFYATNSHYAVGGGFGNQLGTSCYRKFLIYV